MYEIEVIVKNNVTYDVMIEDLGVKIKVGESTALTDIISLSEICNSRDLKNNVLNGNLTINNGEQDLDDLSLPWVSLQTVGHNILNPIIIKEIPPSNVSDGSIWMDKTDWTAYCFDSTSNIWIGLSELQLTFAEHGTVRNRFVRLYNVSDSNLGFYLPKHIIIKRIGINATRIKENTSLHIYSSGNLVWNEILSLENISPFYYTKSLFVNINSNNYVQVYIDGNGIQKPIMNLYFSWRY